MHTTAINGWTIHHDGDPQGSRIIIRGPSGDEAAVPYDVLREFVGRMEANALIGAVESMSGAEFLDARRPVAVSR